MRMRLGNGVRWATAGVVAGVAAGTFVPAAAPARAAAEGEIVSLDVEARVTIEGAVEVTETVAYDLGEEPQHGVTRALPTAGTIDGYGFRDFGLTGVSARSLEADLPVTREEGEGQDLLWLRVGGYSGETELSGVHEFEFSYTYERLVVAHDDAVEYHAAIAGTGWRVPVERTVARVHLPSALAAAEKDGRAWCYAGDPGTDDPCTAPSTDSFDETPTADALHPEGSFTASRRPLVFAHGRLEPGQAMSVRVRFDEPTALSAAPDREGEGDASAGASSRGFSYPYLTPVVFFTIVLVLAVLFVLAKVSSVVWVVTGGRRGGIGGGGGPGGIGGGGGDGGGGC